jgi:hypothetical protein
MMVALLRYSRLAWNRRNCADNIGVALIVCDL